MGACGAKWLAEQGTLPALQMQFDLGTFLKSKMSPPVSRVAGDDIVPAAARTGFRCSVEGPAVVYVGAVPLASTEAALCLGGT